MSIAWDAAGASHVGRVRRGNEDAYRVHNETGVFLVADGMGGHAAGEIASTLAADAALEVLERASAGDGPAPLRAAFEEGFRRIATHSANNPATHGMGTTLTATVFGKDGSLQVGHIGDSRLYQLRSGSLRQLTQDHTWVQAEVDAGRLPEAAARTHPLSHLLLRVLAADSPLDADYFDLGVAPDDLYLLCTDGLHNHVYGRSLQKNLQAGGTPAEIVERLIALANRRGGRDNITAIAVRIR